MNQRYLESITHTSPTFHFFFVLKLKLMTKSSDFLLLGVTDITLVLRFVKSNKFYDVQTAKVVTSKDVSC